MYHVAPPFTAMRLKDACGNPEIYIRRLQEGTEPEEVSFEEEVSRYFSLNNLLYFWKCIHHERTVVLWSVNDRNVPLFNGIVV